MRLYSKMKSVPILLAILVGSAAATQCTPIQIQRAVQASRASQPHIQIGTAIRTDAGANFLRLAAALHNQPFLVCTRAHESDTAGGYHAYNPGGPYYGAYQFLQNTWNNTAAHAGWGFLVGAQITNVNGFWQDMVAWHLYQWQGNAPWVGRC